MQRHSESGSILAAPISAGPDSAPASSPPASLQTLFHPAVAGWFADSFAAPTPAQAEAWPAIKAGRHTLIAAPTGSGKTLAAFLAAIDDLVRQGLEGRLTDATQVVYVSPLKALSNDIHRNLEAPLAGIRERAAPARGLPDVEIRTWVRTGDTPASERARMRRRPPHILVTTPEVALRPARLGIRAARCWRRTRSVIVDEIHAVAPNKRGAHLALSLERLAALCGDRLQRIGLSATQNPIEAVAHFLAGAAADGRPAAEVAIVDAGHQRPRDLDVEMPDSPLEAVMSNEVWTQVYDRLAELIEEHRTTLVFVNTRRMAERVARELTERLGERRGHRPSRQHGQGAPARGRAAAQARRAEGAWSRPPRSNSASTSATSTSSASSVRRARSRPFCSASAAPATRSTARRRGGCFRCRATISSNARRCSTASAAASSTGSTIPEKPLDVLAAADRRRGRGAGLAGGRALRPPAARLALPQSDARGLRRGRPDAGRGLRHPPRPARRAHPSRRGQRHPARPARRADDRADLRRHDSRHRRLSGAARAREPRHRHGQRGFRRREHGRRRLPARQRLLSHPAGRARDRPGRGRQGRSRRTIPFWLGEAPGRTDALSTRRLAPARRSRGAPARRPLRAHR